MTERTEKEEKVMQLEATKIRKHVEKLMGEYGASRGEMAITRGSKWGDNYTSSIYRVTLKNGASGQEPELSFVLKRPPLDPTRRKIVQFDKMFARELYFYREIIPIISEVLARQSLTLVLFPKLYATGTEYGDEIFIMEDLGRTGYRMHASKMLDYQHLAITLRLLARFHAYSFVLRVKRPDAFEKLKSTEEPLFRVEKADEAPRWVHAISLYNLIAQALADEEVHYRERFARFTENIQENMVEAVRGSAAEPYAVLNHGDAWTNNILFKYSRSKSGEEEPTDLKFVDFQLYRYASPVLDILYVLFCCCTYSTRQEFYEALLEVYYESFSNCLKSFGCDSSILFPRRVLHQHLKQFGKFAAGMAIFVIHVFIDDEVEAGEIETKLDIKKLEKRLLTDPLYKRKIIETFRDLTDRDFI